MTGLRPAGFSVVITLVLSACMPKATSSALSDANTPSGKYSFEQLGLSAATYADLAQKTRDQEGIVALDRAPDWLGELAPDAVDYAFSTDISQEEMDAGRELAQTLSAVSASGDGNDAASSALALDTQPASSLAGALGTPLPAHEDCEAGGFCCQWHGKWYKGDTLLNSSDVISNAQSCTGVQGACCIQAIKVGSDNQGIPIYGCNLPSQPLLAETHYFNAQPNTDPTTAEPFYFDTSLEPSGIWSPATETFEQPSGALSDNGLDILTVGGDACSAQPPPPGVPASNFSTTPLTSSDRQKTYQFTFHMGQTLAAATKAQVGTGGALKFIMDGSVEVTLSGQLNFDETWQTTTTQTTHLIPKTFFFGPCDAIQAESVFAIMNHKVQLAMDNVAVCRLYQMTPAAGAARKVFGHRPLTDAPNKAGTVDIQVPLWTYTGERCIWRGCGPGNEQRLACSGDNHLSQFAGIATPVCANYQPIGFTATPPPPTMPLIPTTPVPGAAAAAAPTPGASGTAPAAATPASPTH